MMRFLKSRSSIGVDPGEHSLKWAAVDKKRTCHLWRAELFPERENRDQQLDQGDLAVRTAQLLEQCRQAVPAWNRTVCVAVPDTLSGYFELPQLARKELQTAVEGQIARMLPVSVDELCLRFVQVPPLSETRGQMGIFFVAARNEEVERVRGKLQKAGLEVRYLDFVPMALAREFAANRRPQATEINVLVNMGFRRTQMVVTRGPHIYFSRCIGIAGRDFTYAFQMGEQISWVEGEGLKRKSDATSRVQAWEPFMLHFLGELSKSLAQFRKLPHAHKAEIHAVFLSGGEANLPGLAQRIEEHLSLSTNVDGWQQLKPSDRAAGEGPLYKVALGLALAE